MGEEGFDMEWGLAGEGLYVERGIECSLLDHILNID